MKKILAIIVLYGTRPEQSETFRTLLRSAAACRTMAPDVLFYDNSPESLPEGSLPEKIENSNILYFGDPENPGVGAAYNYGAEIASEGGYEWMLLLDQDTSLPENLIDEYRRWSDRNGRISLFVPRLRLADGVLFSPSGRRFKHGYHLDKISSGVHNFDGLTIVNSGIFIRTAAFIKAGGYDLRIKLDFADSVFVERYNEHYSSFCVTDAVCVQDFSDYTTDKVRLARRFEQFCADARNCPRHSLRDRLGYLSLVMRRTASLTIRTRSLRFVKIMITRYFL